MRKLLIALFLLAPAWAGCLADDAPAAESDPVATSAQDAGVVGGPAPSAPKEAYRVTTTEEGEEGPREATAYPLVLRTNPPKPPKTLEFTGEFTPAQCSPMGNLDPTSSSWRVVDISEGLDVSDVFEYDLSLSFPNTDQSWAEIHLFYGLGSASGSHTEPVREARGEVVQQFLGQGYRGGADDAAWAAVACWYGFVTQPIPYKLTVTYRFAENAIPSGVPIQIAVPEDATRLFVSGVPVDSARGVLSHYRVFGPDDGLLCECALNSNEPADAFALPGAGDYVVLVDHTDNGFVALALDAPSPEPPAALEAQWVTYPILAHDGQALSATVEVEIPSTPLSLGMWMSAPGSEPVRPGFGRGVTATVVNPRGEVGHFAWANFVMYGLTTPTMRWNGWWGIPGPGEWAWEVDHHRFGKGTHTVAVEAENFRGQLYMWTSQYVRV